MRGEENRESRDLFPAFSLPVLPVTFCKLAGGYYQKTDNMGHFTDSRAGQYPAAKFHQKTDNDGIPCLQPGLRQVG